MNLVLSICLRSVGLVGVAHIQITHAGAGAESLDPPTDDTVLVFGAQAAQAEVVEHIVDDTVEALGAGGLIRAAGIGDAGLSVLGEAVDDILALTGVPS